MVRLTAGLLLALSLFPTSLPAAGDGGNDAWSGSYRGRVLTELFLEKQAQRRSVAALAVEQPARRLPDRGDIAVIDASGGVVAPANFLDLQGSTVTFTPNGGGYLGEASTVAFDDAARDNGVPLGLGDDDTQAVVLPFDFPFFGKPYGSVFVNSDGTLTFGEGDVETSARSLARAVAGPPRIAPLFADLDPSALGAHVRAYVSADRAVFTWDRVPEFGGFRGLIFQVSLAHDGAIALNYLSATIGGAIVGVFPGASLGEPAPADLSGSFAVSASGAAEIFQLFPNLDEMTATRRFYADHDDAYDFVFLFNNFGLSPGIGTFAYELNVRNDIVGIGEVLPGEETFDLGAEFGSPRRLSSFVNFGPLSAYPDNPSQIIPIVGENTPLSIVSHEAEHRWGIYVNYLDPVTQQPSSGLLGRGLAHWNFFFNSRGSFLEGSDILDNGAGQSPRFLTGPSVTRYSDFDLYLMGAASAQEAADSFLVEQPQGAGNTNPGRLPESGVSFNGNRENVSLADVIAAEGARKPDYSMAQRSFNAAFVLLVDDGAPPPSDADIEKLDRLRREWETYFALKTNYRMEVDARLRRQLHLSFWPGSAVFVGRTSYGEARIAKPLDQDLMISLQSDSAAVSTPPSVVIQQGKTSAPLLITGVAPGKAELSATAFGGSLLFDSPSANIQVLPADAALEISVVSGDNQTGAEGAPLANPVVVRVTDQNRTPVGAVSLTANANGSGSAMVSKASTGPDGLAEISWTLASSIGVNELVIRAAGTPYQAKAKATSLGGFPAFPAEGVVSAADLASVGLSPGGIAAVFGANLAPAVATADSFPLPRQLAEVQVFVNGIPAPLFYVSPSQINFQVPWGLHSTNALVSVVSPAGASAAVFVPVAPLQPALFAIADTGVAAAGFPSDGLSTADRAAHAGEYVALFATGLGDVSDPPELGEPASGFFLSETLFEPSATIGGRDLPVTFSGLAPGFSGLYQVNVQLPADLAPGRYELFLTINGLASRTIFVDVE